MATEDYEEKEGNKYPWSVRCWITWLAQASQVLVYS